MFRDLVINDIVGEAVGVGVPVGVPFAHPAGAAPVGPRRRGGRGRAPLGDRGRGDRDRGGGGGRSADAAAARTLGRARQLTRKAEQETTTLYDSAVRPPCAEATSRIFSVDDGKISSKTLLVDGEAIATVLPGHKKRDNPLGSRALASHVQAQSEGLIRLCTEPRICSLMSTNFFRRN